MPALQFDASNDGLIAQRRSAVIPLPRLMTAQVSPTTAVYHCLQFSVVPLATLAPNGGGIGIMAYWLIENRLGSYLAMVSVEL